MARKICDCGSRVRAHIDRHQAYQNVDGDLGAADYGIAQPVTAGDPALIGAADQPAQRRSLFCLRHGSRMGIGGRRPFEIAERKTLSHNIVAFHSLKGQRHLG
jgi:hypothetical protein